MTKILYATGLEKLKKQSCLWIKRELFAGEVIRELLRMPVVILSVLTKMN